MKKPADYIPSCGFLLLNKPIGITTFRILRPVKNMYRGDKVGHAGTLDEDASGLVISGVGDATRLLNHVEAQYKEYTFQLHFGYETDSGDATGVKTFEGEKTKITTLELSQILHEFIGEIEQVPPSHSALKIDGKRASDRVRAGEVVKMKSRKVSIFALDILDDATEDNHNTSKTCITLRCKCSKGTYIRSLGRDLARRLSTCGHVSHIFRTAIGAYLVDQAIAPESLLAMDKETLQNTLIPVDKMIPGYDYAEIGEEHLTLLRNGVQLTSNQFKMVAASADKSEVKWPGREEIKHVFIRLRGQDLVLAMGEVTPDQKLRPRIQLRGAV